MGLSWINPLYLSGLLLLALPVLIHLVQKQHSQGKRFPSLMFLQQIPQREKRRFEIRHWLLLALRCLLLALIVFAFARPFLSTESGTAELEPGRKDSVIVLDRSYSMRIADHWQQALDLALQRVDRKQPLDRIGIVLFDEETEILSDLTTSADNLRALLRPLSPGYKATRLPAAIEQAARLLAGSNASGRQILVISDFQAAAAPSVAKISTDIELTALPVEVTRVANASITSVAIEPSSRAAADEFSLTLEVTNRAATPLRQEVILTLDRRELARRELMLAPASTVSESFDRLNVSDDLLRGTVSLGDDALALDNRHFFVYSSRQQVPLLIVEGPAARANQSFYLENALKLARNPAFRVERRALNALKAEELQNFAVVIINDLSIPGGDLGEALGEFVAAGGGLMVSVGAAEQPNWPAAYLPGSPGRKVDAKRGAAYNMTTFEFDHPLSITLGARNTTDLSLARVYSYRELQPGTDDEVVARYSDGAVALVERRVGQGRVLLSTTTLDTHWSDLALQPAFLPFLHQSLRHLTAFESHAKQSRIGDIADVMRYARALAGTDAIVAAAADGPLIVESPSAREIRVSRQSPLLTLAEPGFYQVHHATPAGVEITLAANIDPREANQEKLDVDRFVEEIRASAEPPATGAVLTRRQAAEHEQQQQLAYAILLAVLALTLVEALSANWIGARRTRGTG
ncbi:MAG: BatA domain-containing protein [Gammaproteobacteria bacterium]|nr:BatA domain-containing protein [Gammaproteobacteria bacterium]